MEKQERYHFRDERPVSFIRIIEECDINENQRKTKYDTENARGVPEVFEGNLPPVEVIEEQPDKPEQHGNGTFYGK